MNIKQHWIYSQKDRESWKEYGVDLSDYKTPKFDKDGIEMGGKKWPWKPMDVSFVNNLGLSQKDFGYRIGPDGYIEVTKPVWDAIVEDIENNYTWQPFDEETWMK